VVSCPLKKSAKRIEHSAKQMTSGFGVLAHCKISNSKHQITNKSQIFTLWNPPEEGRQEAAFHRAGIQ